MPRAAITAEQLARMHPSLTPVVVHAGHGGYAVVVSILNSLRWLHTDGGLARFAALDEAAAELRRAGVQRFAVDLSGINT